MSDPKHDQEVARAAKLLKMRGTGGTHRKVAVERKIRQLPAHVVQKAQAQTEVLEMPPEHILAIGDGLTPDMFIDKQVGVLKAGVDTYWRSYSKALDNFQTAMSFSSEDEAESKYLAVALKAAAKVDLDLFLEGVSEGCPELAVPIKMAKEVITAEIEEHERVEKAEGEVKISEFIQTSRDHIDAFQRSDATHLDDLGRNMKAEYHKTQGDVGKEVGSVAGDGAVMLDNLQKSTKRFQGVVATKTVSVIQEQISETFAKMGPDLVGPITAGLHKNATLYLDCRAYRDENGKWEWKGGDDSWTLMTNAPKPDRVVSSLLHALKGEGKTIVGSDLKKVVKATLDIESGHMLESDNYDDIYIRFTSIEDVDFETADASLHGDDPKEAIEAWNAVIKSKVAAIEAVHGKNG